MREQLIQRVAEEFLNANYLAIYCASTHSCFDFVAKRDDEALLLKILENIDSFSKDEAYDLKRIAFMFTAKYFLVGERTKEFKLEDGVVYERYGVPASSFNTFRNMITDEELPKMRKFKEMFVNIDGEKMSKRRNELKMSREELSKVSGISKETLYRYEHGIVSAREENARKVENVLKEELRKSIDPFSLEKTEAINEKTLLSILGFDTVKIKVAPFDLLAKRKEVVVAGGEADRRTIIKRAALYSKISDLLNSYSCFMLKKSVRDSIDGIPVVRSNELKEIKKAGEFIKLIKERGG
jgi:putative transcriptional regulator